MPEEVTREKGRIPAGVEKTLEILTTAEEVFGRKRQEVLGEQIDNLLEAAFDAESGLSPEERKGIQEAAKTLKDEIDREAQAWGEMKGALVEAGWFEEGEEMTKKYGAN